MRSGMYFHPLEDLLAPSLTSDGRTQTVSWELGEDDAVTLLFSALHRLGWIGGQTTSQMCGATLGLAISGFYR